MEYTFNDWLEGKPEPTGFSWIYEKESLNTSQPKRNPVYLEISKAKNFTFDKALEFTLYSMKANFLERIENLNDSKRKLFIEKTIQESEKHYNEFDVRKLIDHSPPNKFEGINGEKYLQVKDQHEALNEGKITRCLNNLNKAFFAVVHFEMSEFYEEYLSNPELVEKLENLPHKLCILYDLGILDLIEDRFRDIHYKGKARETDKAKLIASLLGVDNFESIRQSLKNKDYINTKQKKNVTETLKKHGLEPVKFID